MFGSENLLVLKGAIHAKSPILHSSPQGKKNADNGGNRTYGRKLKMFIKTKDASGNDIQKFEYIPVVSGNGIRGQCRRLLASHLMATLEVDPGEIPAKVLYLLFAGGVLEDKKKGRTKANGNGSKSKASDKDAPKIDIEARRKIRQMLPMIDLLGGAYKNNMLRGRLSVGFAVPMVRELTPLYEGKNNGDLPTLYELRLAAISPDNGLAYARHIDPDVIPVVLGEDVLEETDEIEETIEEVVESDNDIEDKEDNGDSEKGLGDEEGGERPKKKDPRMIFSSEGIPMGTDLWHEFMLDDANEVTRACFNFMLHKFFDWGHIGGKMSTGHGAFTAEYVASDGSPVPDDYSAYLEFIASRKDEIADFLRKGFK